MTRGPILGPLLRFILPLIGSSIFQQLYSTVDFLFVGNFLDKTAAQAVSGQGAPRVLFLRAAASGVKAKSSEGTVLGEMLRDLGCVNIADGSTLLEDLSLEKIIEEDPYRIFIVPQGDDAEAMERTLNDTLTGNPAWAGLTAVKEGRVHYMDKHLFHFKPNARWGEAYEELEALLYGA